MFGLYVNRIPINIAASAGFRSVFHIVVARDCNRDFELELELELELEVIEEGVL